MSRSSSSLIQVFCKAPEPGKVKTRMQPQLTPEQSAQLHMKLAIHTLQKVSGVAGFSVELWCSPDCKHPFFQQMSSRFGVKLCAQSDGVLGKRMLDAMRQGLQRHQQVLLIGCDIPSFVERDFQDASAQLKQDATVVIAPTEDGGYGLIGATHAIPELFEDITWGSACVMQQTRRKINQAGIKHVELAEQWDVDEYSDYQRLVNMNAGFKLT